MPSALNKDGYNFFFYSNEHDPIHVHVRNGSGNAKFDVADEVQLLESKGMKVQSSNPFVSALKEGFILQI